MERKTKISYELMVQACKDYENGIKRIVSRAAPCIDNCPAE